MNDTPTVTSHQAPPLFAWLGGAVCNTTQHPTPSTSGTGSVLCPLAAPYVVSSITWLTQVGNSAICSFLLSTWLPTPRADGVNNYFSHNWNAKPNFHSERVGNWESITVNDSHKHAISDAIGDTISRSNSIPDADRIRVKNPFEFVYRDCVDQPRCYKQCDAVGNVYP